MVGAATAAAALRVSGANDRIRLGIIGSGGRGQYLMKRANEAGNIEWVAISDIYDARRDKAETVANIHVAKYANYHELLDRKDIDGVIVATFDHVHSQISIDACKAGKDVYVEKPMTSLPEQGPPLIRAVRENKRILQVGMQQRTTAHFAEAKQKYFDCGVIGKVNMVRTIWNGNSGYLTPVPPGMEQKPAGLDWNSCLAWLPKTPWDPKRYFNRFADWNFSTGGQSGGLFVHMVDVVHWFMNLTRPLAAVAGGGIYLYDDGRDTPDNVNFIVEYPEKLNVTFEATITDMINRENADIVFMGTGGRLSIFRYGYKFIPSKTNTQAAEATVPGVKDTHMDNWLDCMRSRKQPNADVVQGHYSAMSCHLGNIAYKQRNRATWQKEWDI
jgi:predicted dehydrogenase